MLAPINRIPPEVLSLIPDSWNGRNKDRGVIALTHVCRAWREVFTSRSSLWTNFYCEDADKTRVYLERSKSSPIDVRIDQEGVLFPRDPLLQIIPLATSRLKSLHVKGSQDNIPDITSHLSHPAPLLEDLLIDGGCEFMPEKFPALAISLFDGDLSSLRKLRLKKVRTELPWRNMVNLTSFSLGYGSETEVSICGLLDFFESAPRLREFNVATPTPGPDAQNGRLVSLTHLKTAKISPGEPPSILLAHLLIPVGAKLTTQAKVANSLIEANLPRPSDNLRNFPDFTKVHACAGPWFTHLRFSGPNGEFCMAFMSDRDHAGLVLETLAQLDTSKTEQLRYDWGDAIPGCSPYQALHPMNNLRTLTLYRFKNPNIFTCALHPGVGSSVVVCPKLEEIVIVLRIQEKGETLDMGRFVEMAAARASGGAKLKSVGIFSRGEVEMDVSELAEHVLHVECGPDVPMTKFHDNKSGDEAGSSDEED